LKQVIPSVKVEAAAVKTDAETLESSASELPLQEAREEAMAPAADLEPGVESDAIVDGSSTGLVPATAQPEVVPAIAAEPEVVSQDSDAQVEATPCVANGSGDEQADDAPAVELSAVENAAEDKVEETTLVAEESKSDDDADDSESEDDDEDDSESDTDSNDSESDSDSEDNDSDDFDSKDDTDDSDSDNSDSEDDTDDSESEDKTNGTEVSSSSSSSTGVTVTQPQHIEFEMGSICMSATPAPLQATSMADAVQQQPHPAAVALACSDEDDSLTRYRAVDVDMDQETSGHIGTAIQIIAAPKSESAPQQQQQLDQATSSDAGVEMNCDRAEADAAEVTRLMGLQAAAAAAASASCQQTVCSKFVGSCHDVQPVVPVQSMDIDAIMMEQEACATRQARIEEADELLRAVQRFIDEAKGPREGSQHLLASPVESMMVIDGKELWATKNEEADELLRDVQALQADMEVEIPAQEASVQSCMQLPKAEPPLSESLVGEGVNEASVDREVSQRAEEQSNAVQSLDDVPMMYAHVQMPSPPAEIKPNDDLARKFASSLRQMLTKAEEAAKAAKQESSYKRSSDAAPSDSDALLLLEFAAAAQVVSVAPMVQELSQAQAAAPCSEPAPSMANDADDPNRVAEDEEDEDGYTAKMHGVAQLMGLE
jgi:hypothetical protein